jgi:hypothetical protein
MTPGESLYAKLVAEARAEPRTGRATEAERAAELEEIRFSPKSARIREKVRKLRETEGLTEAEAETALRLADRWEAKL